MFDPHTFLDKPYWIDIFDSSTFLENYYWLVFWTNDQIKISNNSKTNPSYNKLVQIRKPVQMIINQSNIIESVQTHKSLPK